MLINWFSVRALYRFLTLSKDCAKVVELEEALPHPKRSQDEFIPVLQLQISISEHGIGPSMV